MYKKFIFVNFNNHNISIYYNNIKCNNNNNNNTGYVYRQPNGSINSRIFLITPLFTVASNLIEY